MTTISTSSKQLLTFSMLEKVGPAKLRELLIQIKNGSSLSGLVEPLLSQIDGKDQSWRKAESDANDQIAKAEKNRIKILSPLDSQYPVLLSAASDYPPLIWLKGNLSKNSDKSIAVVGTRKPTEHGSIIAERIAKHFSCDGWSIVSGLALGCDTAAHTATLDAKGHTVAVLAHGLQTIYPKENINLSKRILDQGGALLSEFPIDTLCKPKNFIIRDKTQAALSQGVIMVQSNNNGGSLHALRAALNYQRWVAVPYPTKIDIQEKSSMIEANLLLAGGTVKEKCQLIRCKHEALERIIILKSKDDYSKLSYADSG